MGWSHAGNTRQKYQHYYNDDSFDAMLMIDGLVSPSGKSKKDILKPRQCPNCNEGNKPESRFCAKCKFVLTYDAFNEALQEKEQQKKELEEMRAEQAEIKNLLQILHESKIKERDWHKQEMKMLEDRMKGDEMLREKRKRD
jgi:hypothetical protein